MERQARPVKVILHIEKKNVTFRVLQIGEMPRPPAYTLARGGCTFWERTFTCRVVSDNEVVLAVEGGSQRTINRVQTQNVIILASEFPLDNDLFRGSWTKLFVGGS